jgi:bifunctional DNA-binding transcriptional regulator/antitoxin component of YhaV-PrlF toxin-antitoxin module
MSLGLQLAVVIPNNLRKSLKLKKEDTLQAKVDDYNVLGQDITLDTEITVIFSEKIGKNSIDIGSLTLFNLDGVVDPTM